METIVRPEGQQPAQFTHIYDGKFIDRNKNIRTAGILTYAPDDNVEVSIRQQINSAPVQTATIIEKFRNYTSPGLGAIKLHYGHADDPKVYENLTHGVKSDRKSFTTKECVNPRLQTRFENLRNELNERVYSSKQTCPLGRAPVGFLPPQMAATLTFGKLTRRGLESAKECINPNKPRYEVELESSDKHDMYVFSHGSYEPAEQVDRVYSNSFDPYERYGVPTRARYDGAHTREALRWAPKHLFTRTDTMMLDRFREKHTSQVGRVLDPNKETRFLGPHHVFGLNNRTEVYAAGDVIHNRPEEKVLKGKDRERAYLASIRSNISRFNMIKFKTLVDAFKFYDKDKDGFISRDELRLGCEKIGLSLADELLDLMLHECDYDRDGKIGFLEFVNFLCYKDSMKTGIPYKASEDKSENREIRDDEGRFLLCESDLVHKYKIPTNELVPRTLVNQIDMKSGSWKTTYDVINEAPFRLEPIKKRVYGVPSIRSDIPAPELKKIQDKTNYGDEGDAWSLLVPSVFTHHGVYEKDVFKPRTKSELTMIIKNSGIELSSDLFNSIWSMAAGSADESMVSVEQFKKTWSQLNSNRETYELN